MRRRPKSDQPCTDDERVPLYKPNEATDHVPVDHRVSIRSKSSETKDFDISYNSYQYKRLSVGRYCYLLRVAEHPWVDVRYNNKQGWEGVPFLPRRVWR